MGRSFLYTNFTHRNVEEINHEMIRSVVISEEYEVESRPTITQLDTWKYFKKSLKTVYTRVVLSWVIKGRPQGARDYALPHSIFHYIHSTLVVPPFIIEPCTCSKANLSLCGCVLSYSFI